MHGGRDPGELLASAAAEASSEHPLAWAIPAKAAGQRLAVPPVTGFEAAAGFGVTAKVGGHQILVGRPAFLTGHGLDLVRS